MKYITDDKIIKETEDMKNDLDLFCKKYGFENALFVTYKEIEKESAGLKTKSTLIKTFISLKDSTPENEKSLLNIISKFFNRTLFIKKAFEFFNAILDDMDEQEAKREKKEEDEKKYLEKFINQMTDEEKTKYFELVQVKKELVMKQDYEGASKIREEERGLLEKYGYIIPSKRK